MATLKLQCKICEEVIQNSSANDHLRKHSEYSYAALDFEISHYNIRELIHLVKKIGVANIRQFEEREMVLQQEQTKMQADFDQTIEQIDRITSGLDFEHTKDTQGKIKCSV